ELEVETTEADTVEPGSEVRAHLDGMEAVPGRDEATNTSYIDYVDADGATVARVWLATPDALRFRMDRTQPFALRGVAFSDLAAEGLADGVLETIVNYKIQLPASPGLREFALRWRIEGVNGVIG